MSKFRIVKKSADSFGGIFSYRYIVQRKFLWFWVGIDWFYGENDAKNLFDKITGPCKETVFEVLLEVDTNERTS
ncbi:hypothetical protein D3C86_1301890 [compost metagenome]